MSEPAPIDWRNHISVDPSICHGKACITGTRVLVATLLADLAAGRSTEEILRSYPTITSTSFRAAVCYAAELANERVIAVAG